MLNLAQKEKLRKVDPYLFECIRDIETAVNSLAKQTGADPAGVFVATPNITACNVTSAAGGINVQIVDNSPVVSAENKRPVSYFVDIASDIGFVQVFHVEHMGPARNKNIAITGQTVYVRAYSQLQGSVASKPVAFGGLIPTPVVIAGAAAPAPQAFQGTGNTTVSGKGYGVPARSVGIANAGPGKQFGA
jgi:hypothetical protein